MIKMLLGVYVGVVITGLIAYYYINQQSQVRVPEPVLSKCDSIVFANDSLIERNRILEKRQLTYKIGLAQLKMVDKAAHDYLINAGNFKFIEEWDQF